MLPSRNGETEGRVKVLDMSIWRLLSLFAVPDGNPETLRYHDEVAWLFVRIAEYYHRGFEQDQT